MQTTPGTPLTSDGPRRPPVPRPQPPDAPAVGAVAVAAYVCSTRGPNGGPSTRSTEGVPRRLIGDLLQLRPEPQRRAPRSAPAPATQSCSPLIALVVIAVCIRMASRLGSLGWAVALGLVLGGALGNVTDRMFRTPAPFRGPRRRLPRATALAGLQHRRLRRSASPPCSFVVLSLRGVRLDGSVEPGASPTTTRTPRDRRPGPAVLHVPERAVRASGSTPRIARMFGLSRTKAAELVAGG